MPNDKVFYFIADVASIPDLHAECRTRGFIAKGSYVEVPSGNQPFEKAGEVQVVFPDEFRKLAWDDDEALRVLVCCHLAGADKGEELRAQQDPVWWEDSLWKCLPCSLRHAERTVRRIAPQFDSQVSRKLNTTTITKLFTVGLLRRDLEVILRCHESTNRSVLAYDSVPLSKFLSGTHFTLQVGGLKWMMGAAVQATKKTMGYDDELAMAVDLYTALCEVLKDETLLPKDAPTFGEDNFSPFFFADRGTGLSVKERVVREPVHRVHRISTSLWNDVFSSDEIGRAFCSVANFTENPVFRAFVEVEFGCVVVRVLWARATLGRFATSFGALYTLFEPVEAFRSLHSDFECIYDIIVAFFSRYGSGISTVTHGHLSQIAAHVPKAKELKVLFPVLLLPLVKEIYRFSKKKKQQHTLRDLQEFICYLSDCCLRPLTKKEESDMRAQKCDFLNRRVSCSLEGAHFKSFPCTEPKLHPNASTLTLQEINKKIGTQGLKVEGRELPRFEGDVVDAVYRAGLYLRKERLRYMDWDGALLDECIDCPLNPSISEGKCSSLKKAWKTAQNKRASSSVLRTIANGACDMEPRKALYEKSVTEALVKLADELETGRERNNRVGLARLFELEDIRAAVFATQENKARRQKILDATPLVAGSDLKELKKSELVVQVRKRAVPPDFLKQHTNGKSVSQAKVGCLREAIRAWDRQKREEEKRGTSSSSKKEKRRRPKRFRVIDDCGSENSDPSRKRRKEK